MARKFVPVLDPKKAKEICRNMSLCPTEGPSNCANCAFQSEHSLREWVRQVHRVALPCLCSLCAEATDDRLPSLSDGFAESCVHYEDDGEAE